MLPAALILYRMDFARNVDRIELTAFWSVLHDARIFSPIKRYVYKTYTREMTKLVNSE